MTEVRAFVGRDAVVRMANWILPVAVHDAIDNRKWLASVRRHRSHLHYTLAPRYTEYLEACRKSYVERPPDPAFGPIIDTFQTKGFATLLTDETRSLANSMLEKIEREERANPRFWSDDLAFRSDDIYLKFPEVERLFQGRLGDLLRGIYGSHFKIYYGSMYKSAWGPSQPRYSQLWHADGGPGTCTNVLFCLSAVDRGNGAIEFLPWTQTLRLFGRERRAMKRRLGRLDTAEMSREELRAVKCAWIEEEIQNRHVSHVEQPAGPSGLVVLFRNNLIHRGGFVSEPGRHRVVCVFHVYPCDRPTPFEIYRQRGIRKTGGYPLDPAEI